VRTGNTSRIVATWIADSVKARAPSAGVQKEKPHNVEAVAAAKPPRHLSKSTSTRTSHPNSAFSLPASSRKTSPRTRSSRKSPSEPSFALARVNCRQRKAAVNTKLYEAAAERRSERVAHLVNRHPSLHRARSLAPTAVKGAIQTNWPAARSSAKRTKN